MSVQRWQERFDRLDRLSRTRSLTMRESISLERAIGRLDAARAEAQVAATGWNSDQEDVFARLVGEGMSIRRAAVAVGKTPDAGISKWRRIRANRAVAA